MRYLLVIASSLFTGGAWLLPGRYMGAVCAWVGLLLFIRLLKGGINIHRTSYAIGVIAHAVGFYWVAATMMDFGGLSTLSASALAGAFILVSALQFLIISLLYANLPKSFSTVSLRATSAIVTAEVLIPRLFPWQFGHTQLAVLPLIQIADIGGVALITFVIAWVCESVIDLRERRSLGARIAPVTVLICSLLYGHAAIRSFKDAGGPEQPVTVVQGNIANHDRAEGEQIMANIERYKGLTLDYARPGDLVIWPESVIQEYVHVNIRSVDPEHPYLPYVGPELSLVTGSLTYESSERFFNSVLAILPDGSILPPYHKNVLMPFGEYAPFVDLFPWIRNISKEDDFSTGSGAVIFEIPMQTDRHIYNLRMAALICYEDVISSLARSAVREGAELLVNLSNDGWFGESLAPFQHHMIASFRAVENRRFLVRATNTGITGVVNPLGESIDRLPPFSEGVLRANVRALSYISPYTRYFGDTVWTVVGLGIMLLAIVLCLLSLVRCFLDFLNSQETFPENDRVIMHDEETH